jgi:hypothetical protein
LGRAAHFSEVPIPRRGVIHQPSFVEHLVHRGTPVPKVPVDFRARIPPPMELGSGSE